MSTGTDWIAQHDLLRIDYAMVAITSTVFAVRVAVQIWRRRPIGAQDVLLAIAFLAYLAFSILYIVITPIFFKLQAVEAGQMAPWPTMMTDLRFASEVMWQSGMEYWTCLWFVKFSLLALYKKLLAGMPKTYLWVWWATVIFCIATWATCIITGPGLACDDTKAFFEEGKLCLSLGEKRRQTISLYYAYAVDTLTNLMVMFLPIKLIWNLQMEKAKKIGCGLLFASGFVCIIFSTIRIVQVGRDGKPQSPDPKWLTLWTIVECSTAVMIGCCPMLASALPKGWVRSSHTQGYVQQSPNQSDETESTSHRLRDMHSSKSRKKRSEKTSENVSVASHDELPERRTGGTGIRVTDEMREQHKRRMEENQHIREEPLETHREEV